MKKIKIITSLGLVLAIVGLIVGTVIYEARATTPTPEGTVAATVTVENIALTVVDGVIAYGIIPIATTTDTTSGGVNDSQIVTNTGNVTQDFNIRGYNSANWALGATAGTDIYRHDFCIEGTGTAPDDPCDVNPTWVSLTTTLQTLSTSTAVGATQLFDLRIHTPTATTHFGQQNVNVTIQAIRTP